MSRIFNFSAGPAVLPEEVLARAGDEMLDWRGTGMCVMEMSHRGKEFMSIAAEAEKDLRDRQQLAQVFFRLGGDRHEFPAAMAHFHHAHAGAAPIEHFVAGAREHFLGQDGRSRAEIEYPRHQ